MSVLSLSSCMMGPDYKKPETPAGDAWRLTPATAESLANLPWWDLLKDQELQGLIRIALEENQDLRVAVASVEQFRAQLLISKFDLAPSLGYTAEASTYHNTNNQALAFGSGAIIPSPAVGSSGGTDFSREYGVVGLKWELDLWGRIRRSIEASRAQLLSQEENQRAVIIGLVGNVAEAYFDLRALDLQVDIAKRTLKSWEESVRISRLASITGIYRNSIWIASRQNGPEPPRNSPNWSNRSLRKRTNSVYCWDADRARLPAVLLSSSNPCHRMYRPVFLRRYSAPPRYSPGRTAIRCSDGHDRSRPGPTLSAALPHRRGRRSRVPVQLLGSGAFCDDRGIRDLNRPASQRDRPGLSSAGVRSASPASLSTV